MLNRNMVINLFNSTKDKLDLSKQIFDIRICRIFDAYIF